MGRGEESQTLEKWRWSFFIFLVSFFLSGGGWKGASLRVRVVVWCWVYSIHFTH